MVPPDAVPAETSAWAPPLYVSVLEAGAWVTSGAAFAMVNSAVATPDL